MSDPSPTARSRLARLRHALLVVAINLGMLVAGVVAVELALGTWFVPYVLPDPSLMDAHFTFRQTMYEPHGEYTYSRDRFGLRGLHAPIAAVELVTVGGSTTDQKLIPDGQTWQDVIAAATGLVVANAGLDGMGSQSHPVVVDEWLHQIPDLKARYYLHYVGINDAALYQTVPISEQPHKYSWSRRIRARSVILRTIAGLRNAAAGPILVNHGATTPLPGVALAPATADPAAIATYVERMYKPNLRRLLALHAERGETAILVSQPSNPAMVAHEDGIVLVQRPETGPWAVALDAINQATAAVCAEQADHCRFVDVARRATFTAEDFYDIVHYTPHGARTLGTFLAGELRFIRDGGAPGVSTRSTGE